MKKVTIHESEVIVKRLLREAGAHSVVTGFEQDKIWVAFRMDDRNIVFRVPIDPPTDERFKFRDDGYKRNGHQIMQAWQASRNAAWIALRQVMQGKLRSIGLGVETVDQAFLAHMVTVTGETIGEIVATLPGFHRRGWSTPSLPEDVQEQLLSTIPQGKP